MTVDLLEDFKTLGLPVKAETSRATSIAKLRIFFKEAYRREWLTEPLVEKIKPVKAVYDQKKPFTEDELALIQDDRIPCGR